jgi:hypothetical protein
MSSFKTKLVRQWQDLIEVCASDDLWFLDTPFLSSEVITDDVLRLMIEEGRTDANHISSDPNIPVVVIKEKKSSFAFYLISRFKTIIHAPLIPNYVRQITFVKRFNLAEELEGDFRTKITDRHYAAGSLVGYNEETGLLTVGGYNNGIGILINGRRSDFIHISISRFEIFIDISANTLTRRIENDTEVIFYENGDINEEVNGILTSDRTFFVETVPMIYSELILKTKKWFREEPWNMIIGKTPTEGARILRELGWN